MRFPSYNIASGALFLDIVRLVDKVQAKATRHLLNENDIRQAFTWATDTYVNTVDSVVVEVFTGFSFKGFKFPSACTYLYIRATHGIIMQGCVKRMAAPEQKYGCGSRYAIALHGVHGEVTVPPGFRLTGTYNRERLTMETRPQRSA